MTETRTMRVKTPTDLLALVPYLFGFHPKDSLVMVAARAKQPFNVRVDLPTDSGGQDDLAIHLSKVSRRHGAKLAMLALYTEDPALADSAYEALRARLGEVGVKVGEAIRADGNRWWSLTDCTDACCPADGTPYDIASHEFTAQGVLDGKVTLGSRRELADSLVTTDLAEVEEVERAADEALRRLQPRAARAHLVREGRWVEERVSRYLEDGERLDAQDVGRLLVGMVCIEVRDVAWAQMRHSNADRHVDLWRDLVRRSPRDLMAAPAALLGFAAWLSGDGALAWCAVDRCQETEPDYSLALLLTDALTAAVPPSSWQPVGPEMLTLFAG
jgi:Domain of unknown function (DUF4192)